MSRKKIKILFIAAVVLLAVIIGYTNFGSVSKITGAALLIPTQSRPAPEPLTARLSEIMGRVKFKFPEQLRFDDATLGQILKLGSSVKTTENSRARMDLSNSLYSPQGFCP